MSKRRTDAETLDRDEVLRNAMALARVAGAGVLAPPTVARRCGVEVEQLPADLRDTRALRHQTALAARTMLATEIDASVEEMEEVSGMELLTVSGECYIAFARNEPGWFDVAFCTDTDMSTAHDARARGARGRTPYEYLEEAVDLLVSEGRVSAEEAPSGIILCWAGVHGIATLATRGPLQVSDPDSLDQISRDVVQRLAQSLLSPDPA